MICIWLSYMLITLCDIGFTYEHVVGLHYYSMVMFTLNDVVCKVGIAYGSCWVYMVEVGYGVLLCHCSSGINRDS